MGKILCATRGGEASIRTQAAAIELAKARGDALVFLYVVDLHFLDKTASSVVVDVEEEMGRMGEFLLLMAQERAAAAGVEAGGIIRSGRVREQLTAAVRDEGATAVVLGQPTDPVSVFEDAGLERFADALAAETGAEVVIV